MLLLGLGVSAAPSKGAPASPATVPDAPTIGTATAGVESADVTFTPNGNGGSAITGFTVTPLYVSSPAFNANGAAVGDLVFSNQNLKVDKYNGANGGNARCYAPLDASGKAALDLTMTFSGDGNVVLNLIFGADPDAYDLYCEIYNDGNGADTLGNLPTGLGVVATGGHRRVLVDRAAGKVWIGNGTAFAGDPEAGTGEAFNFTPGSPVWFGVFLSGVNPGSAQVNSYSTGTFPQWLANAPRPAAAASGSSSPITVPFLTPGVSHTFTVHATNAVGDSAESAASNAVTPT